MSPLAKEVIEILSHENDNQVLAEVLDFYEYLKLKKQRLSKLEWDNIEEIEPSNQEIDLIRAYKSNNETLVDFDDLMTELGLNGK